VPAVLALLSSVLWGAADFAGGTASRRLHPLAVVGVSQLAGLIAVTAWAAAAGDLGLPLDYLPWAVAAGLTGLVGLAAFYEALASGTMGIVAPVAALGVVVPVAAGLLGGESPAVLQLVGVAVAIVGVVLASGPEIGGGARRPLALAALAAVCFGFVLVFVKNGSETSAPMTLVGMRLTTVPIVAVVAVLARSRGGVSVADLPLLAAIGLGDAGANLAFGFASQGDALAIVAVLGSLYPVVTTLLAWFLHHERLRRVQQVGVAAALGGVVLIAGG
jgi:drug/metabolite transporter (DMT)-like permease